MNKGIELIGFFGYSDNISGYLEVEFIPELEDEEIYPFDPESVLIIGKYKKLWVIRVPNDDKTALIDWVFSERPTFEDAKNLVKNSDTLPGTIEDYGRLFGKYKGDFKVITLCGSTRFKNEFEGINTQLTLEGNVVISVGVFGHADGIEITESQKEQLDRIHFQKIDMCDEIFVVNVGGYIGSSTKREIEYANLKGLPVRYLEPVDRR